MKKNLQDLENYCKSSLTADRTRNIIMLLSFKCIHSYNRQLQIPTRYAEFYLATISLHKKSLLYYFYINFKKNIETKSSAKVSKITFNNSNNNNNNNNLFSVEKIQQHREPKKRKLKKFDQKEYWCELLNVSNISYKP